jgi:hypothetical protein
MGDFATWEPGAALNHVAEKEAAPGLERDLWRASGASRYDPQGVDIDHSQ